MVEFEDVLTAFAYVGSTVPTACNVLLDRETGEVFMISDYGDSDELPDDVETSDRYVWIPHVDDLGLGWRWDDEKHPKHVRRWCRENGIVLAEESASVRKAAPVRATVSVQEAAPVSTTARRWHLADFAEIEGVPCPCGTARRALAGVEAFPGTIHLTEIAENARRHYHRTLTETYYVLECEPEATMELDDETIPIRPGVCIVIPPGVRHRLLGRAKVLIVVLPEFDPADEWFD